MSSTTYFLKIKKHPTQASYFPRKSSTHMPTTIDGGTSRQNVASGCCTFSASDEGVTQITLSNRVKTSDVWLTGSVLKKHPELLFPITRSPTVTPSPFNSEHRLPRSTYVSDAISFRKPFFLGCNI